MRLGWLVLLCAGCAGGKPGGDRGMDVDDTGADPTTDGGASVDGVWPGSCAYVETGYTDVSNLAVTLDLEEDDGGVVTGTMSFTSYYTGTTYTYSGAYGLDGTRSGDELVLNLSTPTTTGLEGAAQLVLTVDGDSMEGPLEQDGEPWLDCSFGR